MQAAIHRKDARTGAAPCVGITDLPTQPPGRGRCPMRTFEEMSGPPTIRSIRTTGTNEGSPTGRESYGDGGLVVVVGVTSGQGVRESRTQGEADQVTGAPPDREVSVMPNAEPVVDARRERLC